MLQAAGTNIMTPFALQADIMNGVDSGAAGRDLPGRAVLGHRVKVFVYNQQVTDSLTATFLAAAQRARIPVVGVYETMPTPGYDYQSWMLAEVRRWSAPSRTGLDGAAANALPVQGVTVRLSGRTVLDDVTFSIRPGEFTGLIGSNGAGKTTLFRVILGLQAPDRGAWRRRRTRSRRRRLRAPEVPARSGHAAARPRSRRARARRPPARAAAPVAARRALVDEMLDAVDAGDFADARVGRSPAASSSGS